MSRTAWIPPLFAVAVFALVVGAPILVGLRMLGDANAEDTVQVHVVHLAATTMLWAGTVAAGACVLAWGPAQLLGARVARGRSAILLAACLVPLCIPAYIVYWALWQAWPTGAPVHTWVVEQNLMSQARGVTLWIALVLWAWPLAMFCMAAVNGGGSRRLDDLHALDGVRAITRFRHRLHVLLPGVVIAACVTSAFVFNNTTAFDLAQVTTLGFELRSMMASGATSEAMLLAAWPNYVVIIIALVAVVVTLRRHRGQLSGAPGRSSRFTAIQMLVLLAGSTLIPIGLVSSHDAAFSAESWAMLSRGYGEAVVNTLATATGAGVIGAILSIGYAIGFGSCSRVVRAIFAVQAIGWIAIGAAPGAVTATLLEATLNTPALAETAYLTPIAILAGYLARFGFVAVLVGMWIASAEPRALRDLREIDGAISLQALWRTCRPQWIAGSLTAFAVVFALAVSEVIVTAQLQPPGFDAIAQILLNNMHYQRDDMVVLLTLSLYGLAGAAAVTVALAWAGQRRWLRSTVAPALCVAAVVVSSGCDRNDPTDTTPLATLTAFGSQGESFGQFVYPRAMDADPVTQSLFIVDRSGRIQRFSLDGKPTASWELPHYVDGYPTGITVAPDGRLFVADTHNYCITVFDQEGNLLEQFGTFGEEPGEFTNPCDVAFGPDGRIYVAEFGGNDRIQVFDADWSYLFEWGEHGSEAGQFSRPQSLAISRDGSRVYVCDACNHRIQVFDAEGNLQETFGTIGTNPGEFRYPYGVHVLEDGALLVSEFGNNRLQILEADGSPRAILGTPGSGPGELFAPWTSLAVGGRIYVLDSRNNRVQVIERP